ncbi:SLBB domain-containing protein [Sphingobium sp. BYY-5]|uniref:SLBB domain-containing protein n=1 Tax=Sphingobium sp. BYY-5 TaxID=2926400 RepID=UPI001FA75E1E|nr:SLBB domain-containing protein [Sphingobium sp. BYY-5]MCI4590450.1 SLBB domain-containing protein [Sphingobium sp. BYY-5]
MKVTTAGPTFPTLRLRSFTASISAIALILSASPLAAQTLDNSIPRGLPTDPYGTTGAVGMSAAGAGVAGDSYGRPSQSGVAPVSEAYRPVSIGGTSSSTDAATAHVGPNGILDTGALHIKPAAPGEFESWVRDVTGRKLKRYGSDLLIAGARDFAVPAQTTIPPDYALNVGDTVSISLMGSIDGSVDLEIDRDGNIFLPNVGPVSLIGVHYRDIKDRIAAAIGRQYRGYDVSVSIKRLRGVRVYVTGFANNPGAYSVNSLSTLVNAVLAAGGPSAGGSFRSVKLYRNGAEVADFDLYQLLRKGDRSLDPLIQNEDVLFIPPVGKQVAVIGSVNEEAIYETREGESLADMLALAGGPTNVADPSRLILYRLDDQDTVGSRQIDRAMANSEHAEAGDIIQILPQGTLIHSLDKQQAIVRIEGEVNKPGNYYVPPNTPLSKVLEMAGGLTPRAYVYGTRFVRESVRSQQRRSFLEAVEQMEIALSAAPLTGDRLMDAGERKAQIESARDFLEKLRQKEPDGRLILELPSESSALPDNLPLENNDRIVIPPRVDTVGVFGAVYRPASFLMNTNRPLHVKDFVQQAGGPIRGADKANIFVVRANGSVLTRKRGAMDAAVLPGDTVFVPIKTQSSSVWAKIRDISQIVFQFGLSAAAIAAIN